MPKATEHETTIPNVRIGDLIVEFEWDAIVTGKRFAEWLTKGGTYEKRFLVTGRVVNRTATKVTLTLEQANDRGERTGVSDTVVFRFHDLDYVRVQRFEPTDEERHAERIEDILRRVATLKEAAQETLRKVQDEMTDDDGALDLGRVVYAVEWSRIETIVDAQTRLACIATFERLVAEQAAGKRNGDVVDAAEFVMAQAEGEARRMLQRGPGSKSTNGWANFVEEAKGNALANVGTGGLFNRWASAYDDSARMVAARDAIAKVEAAV